MQMQPLPLPSRCVHTPVAPGTRAGTRGDTSIHHPPSYPLTPYLLTSYLPTYSELNPNTAKNHPLRLSEQSHSRLLYGARRPSHIGRWPKEGSIHPFQVSLRRRCEHRWPQFPRLGYPCGCGLTLICAVCGDRLGAGTARCRDPGVCLLSDPSIHVGKF